MAVPKKKPSKTRQRRRHSAWQARFKLPALIRCKNCGAKKLPHRVCRSCGVYRGRQVLEPSTTIKRVSQTDGKDKDL